MPLPVPPLRPEEVELVPELVVPEVPLVDGLEPDEPLEFDSVRTRLIEDKDLSKSSKIVC